MPISDIINQLISSLVQYPQQWLVGFLLLVLALGVVLTAWVLVVRRSMHKARHIEHLKQQEQRLIIQSEQVRQQLTDSQQQIQQQRDELAAQQHTILNLSEAKARASEQLKQQEHHAQQSEERIAAQHKQMENQFAVLAQRIFEQKIEQTEKQQRQKLESSLQPFREQLGKFQQQVADIYDKDLRDRLSLGGEIQQLKKLNQQISSDAVRLTEALRGQNKIQGNWGEMILEQVLEDSGLRKGQEYDTQASYQGVDGKRRVPDVVVHLPHDKDIVIDSKVSLISYERYISATDDAQRSAACKDFLRSLHQHLNDLNRKAYEKLAGVRTLDFVFMFIPIEAAFLLALEHDTELFRTAFNKQVVLVSPTTLFACLRTVEHLWRYERQNRHAEQIAEQAAGLHDKLVVFTQSMMKVAESLEKATQVHEKALSQFSYGRGNVLSRVRKLKKMGLATKKEFPAQLRRAADAHAQSESDKSANDTSAHMDDDDSEEE